MSKEKIWNFCRYLLAIPAGILGYLFSFGLMILSSKLYAQYATVWDYILDFVWTEFGHIMAFFLCFNITLPKHKFTLTLILSTVFTTISIIPMIFQIGAGTFTLEDFFAYLLSFLAIIISCVLAYKNKFDDFFKLGGNNGKKEL